MKKIKYWSAFLLSALLANTLLMNNIRAENNRGSKPPVYIAFHWHMHQPIYWPYESLVQTQQRNAYGFSVSDVHNQRTGPYTSWPKDAVKKGAAAGLQHFGAQVSFSGSLIENLNSLESSGNGNFKGWKNYWNEARQLTTSLGNPRVDMTAFGYFHPLMGLLDYQDIRRQIKMHKDIFKSQFSAGSYSKGIFPPENAFSERMIPALADEGIEWVLVDNVHFERACEGYPYSTQGNLYEANRSDILNPDPGDWISLNGLWAPTKVSARWARQPHYSEYTDPETGETRRIIVVPADRYLGNEDGRGGFGALNYEYVMSQLESYNTDPLHPILIVLAHDGDNYGGGSSGYYGSNFQNFVNWLVSNPDRFVCTTIQDYLQMFPPEDQDVIHVESGSWSGADNGDPEFMKWLGNPSSSGYSPDRNSWGVITAAKNIVETAQAYSPDNNAVRDAWKYLMAGQTSCYWYWDGSIDGLWDAHPARAANQAVSFVNDIARMGSDKTAPTIFQPQREPYNPGAAEWKISQPSDFTVWTYVYDVSGLKTVKLKFRTDNDGLNSTLNTQNETYAGGSDVSSWDEKEMNGIFITPLTMPVPMAKAREYSAAITGMKDKLVDYFVEAEDSSGNISRSAIMHVWVGANQGGNTQQQVSWMPLNPTKDDTIKIVLESSSEGAKLHWGVNNSGSSWQTPLEAYWPEGSQLFNNSGPAVETPFAGPASDGSYEVNIGPFNDPAQSVNRVAFVIHYNDNSWENNGGGDFQINLNGQGGDNDTSVADVEFIMDGKPDTSSYEAASSSLMKLLLGYNGRELYVATESAQSCGSDVFIYISDAKSQMTASPWAKSGSVAQWSVFLANESSNNWCGWTGAASGSATATAGNFLEGKINVAAHFGGIPECLYISAGRYKTENQGTLISQLPVGNGNQDIEYSELLEYRYTRVTEVDGRRVNDLKLPVEFSLSQNFPNPFNPETIISYDIPYTSHVELKVYDIMGREVASLVNQTKQAGSYSVSFNARGLSSGIYLYSISAGGYRTVRKMLVMK